MYGGGFDRLQDRCGIEISELVSRIDACKGEPFDPWNLLYDSACNIMLDLVGNIGSNFELVYTELEDMFILTFLW